MSNFKIVGKSIPRLDGPDKVRGAAQFLADRDIQGVWIGGTVRSEVPRGKLISVKKNPAFDWSKVVLITAKDLPSSNFVHIVRDEYPILADGVVNYATQAVALVAAPDERTLKEAMNSISLEIEPLEPVLTMDEALEGKQVIWGGDNIVDEYQVNCGDIEKGFAEADLIVEGTYETGLQEHIYLETLGMAAIPDDDGGVEITGSIQCPYYVQNAVATALGIASSKVRVRQTEVGGGFGGKEDYPSILGTHAALLAMRAKKPVRIIYDRTEDLFASPKRHPSRIYQKTGVKKDGTITAMEIDILLDAGAYTTLTMVILQRSVLHANGAYFTPNAKIHGRAVATNTTPTGAFRGFGAPQSIFAMERQMDKIAKKLGVDPLDLKLKNALQNGMRFPHKQVLESGVCAVEVLSRAAELSDYRAKREAYAKESAEAKKNGGRIRRGIGISVALHGSGFTGAAEDTMGTTTRVAFKDGVFTLYTSCVDMGQGGATVLPQIAAERLCVPIERVRHPLPDTRECPNSGPTVASRSTMFIGRVLEKTCAALIEKLRGFIAEVKQCAPDNVAFDDGVFTAGDGSSLSILHAAELYAAQHGTLEETQSHLDTGKSRWDPVKFEGDAYKGYGWIAQAIEVEVDMDTYEVNPSLGTVVAEIGRAVNPALASGQLEGGVLQGCGWSHIESLGIDDKGMYAAGHMSEYLVPTTLDSPNWKVEMLEVPSPEGPFGAKGIGELPANGGAPAFIAAVENATGVCADYIPLTGEKLWMELEKLEPKNYAGGEPR